MEHVGVLVAEVGDEEEGEDDDLEDAGEELGDGEVGVLAFVAAFELLEDLGGEGLEAGGV